MALFNIPVAALLLSLCVALSSAATIDRAPGPVTFNLDNDVIIPVDEQAKYTTIDVAPGPVTFNFDNDIIIPVDEQGKGIQHTTIDVVPDYETFNPYDDIIPVDELAKDRHYLKAQMTAVANMVELFVANEVEKWLSIASEDSVKECLLVCREVYGSAVDEMKEAVESVSAGDFLKANSDVCAFSTHIDTCNECFNGFQTFDDWAKGVAGDCLAKIVKYMH